MPLLLNTIMSSTITKPLPTLAQIVHAAADDHLCHNANDWFGKPLEQQIYSCHAVEAAIETLVPYLYRKSMLKRVNAEFINMGLNLVSGDSFEEFHKHEQQGARYTWLKLAATVLEDEGL